MLAVQARKKLREAYKEDVSTWYSNIEMVLKISFRSKQTDE